jgi:hypothetical protein
MQESFHLHDLVSLPLPAALHGWVMQGIEVVKRKIPNPIV